MVEHIAHIKVDITGIPEVRDMVDNAVKVSFLAGFEMANELWKLSDGGDGISDEEMNARFENWIKNVNQFRDSEEALAKLREKLNGPRGL